MSTVQETLALCKRALSEIPPSQRSDIQIAALAACSHLKLATNFSKVPECLAITLPAEILEQILLFVSRIDLIEVAKAHSRWYAVARGILDHHPIIRSAEALVEYLKPTSPTTSTILPKIRLCQEYKNLRILDLSSFSLSDPHCRHALNNNNELLLTQYLPKRCRQLHTLRLRSCHLSTANTILKAATKLHCLELTQIHLSENISLPSADTDITPSDLAPLLASVRRIKTLGLGSCNYYYNDCQSHWQNLSELLANHVNPDLETLKIRHIPTMTPKAAAQLVRRCGESVKHLELEGSIGHAGRLLTGFRNVESLDIAMGSFAPSPMTYEKVVRLPQLRRFSNFGSSFHLNEEHLRTLLERCLKTDATEELSLSLEALILKPTRPLHIKPVSLLTLNPNLTAVQLPRTIADEAVTILLTTCKSLRHLGLSFSAITNSSIHSISLHCPQLISLDLNSCEQIDYHGLRHLLTRGSLPRMKHLCIESQEDAMRRNYSGNGWAEVVIWKRLVKRFEWVGPLLWKGFELVPDPVAWIEEGGRF